jgi:hypothetical protein
MWAVPLAINQARQPAVAALAGVSWHLAPRDLSEALPNFELVRICHMSIVSITKCLTTFGCVHIMLGS